MHVSSEKYTGCDIIFRSQLGNSITISFVYHDATDGNTGAISGLFVVKLLQQQVTATYSVSTFEWFG